MINIPGLGTGCLCRPQCSFPHIQHSTLPQFHLHAGSHHMVQVVAKDLQRSTSRTNIISKKKSKKYAMLTPTEPRSLMLISRHGSQAGLKSRADFATSPRKTYLNCPAMQSDWLTSAADKMTTA